MVKKSRRFALRQAALARRKKTRRPTLTEKQKQSPGPAPESAAGGNADVAKQASPSDAAQARALSWPSGQDARESAPETPWPYGYVMSDVQRIGTISAVILVLMVILTFFLR